VPDTAIATNPVTEFPAASSEDTVAHFERLLSLETDCWDVHHVLRRQELGFVLLDVRSPDAYASGHVPRAVNLPSRKITEASLAGYPSETMFVVYCSGPHCNGADRAALRLARLGRPVKKMIGGIAGWRDEEYEVVRS
jgi:rhodanese-related sulfurtransferase